MAVTEARAGAPRSRDKNRGFTDNLLVCSDAAYSDVCGFVSREDDTESLDKNYGGGTPVSETCASKLDEGLIDDCARDHHAETWVPSSCRYERAMQNKSREKGIKNNDHVRSRDQEESPRRSNRRRKRTRCRTPEGIIIDLSNDVAGTKHSGIKISVISVHNLLSDAKFIGTPRKSGRACKSGRASKPRPRSSTRDSKRKATNKAIGGSVLAVFYTENRGGTGKTGGSAEPSECRNRPRTAAAARRYEEIRSTSETPRPNVDAIARTADRSGNALNEQRELRAADNLRSFYASDETILGSMKCCHRDAALLLGADNARCPILGAGRAYASAELCCSIFHEQHQEYHSVCEREDYNAETCDFNRAETEAGWTSDVDCIHAAYAKERCRCFCDSCGYDPDINMQLKRLSIPTRATRLLENSAPPELQSCEEIERFESGELRAASCIAAEFATEADEYSRDGGVGGGRCASCDETEAARSSASTLRNCTASGASVFVEAGGSVDDPRESRGADADPEEFGRTTLKTLAEKKKNEWPHKSDSSRSGFVDTCATAMATATGDCIGRCYEPADRSPGEKGGFARGVDPKWIRDSIETDAQQLDYKWKRRIASVDGGARASVDFKGKRDSRYKSEEAIRVQLRERVEIRKRESLQMVEATSQTRGDNASADGKRRDYSLWTSLQMGKIWSQVHDACRNVAKLAATSVGRVTKDAPKSERSRRNPEAADETTHLVGGSSSSCGEASCRGSLMRSQGKTSTKTREKEERAIDDTAESRVEGIEVSTRKKSVTSSSSGRDAACRKCAHRNPGKMENGKSCVSHNERERDGNQDVVGLLPRNEMCGHDEAAYPPQSRLSDCFFTYLEDSAYPGFRSRGGSDDNRDFASSSIQDKQEAARRTNDVEEAESGIGHRDSVSENCVCHTESETCTHCADSRSSLQTLASHELSATPSDVPDVPRSNPLHRELQSVAVSSPETSEQTPEAYMNSADLETERNPMPEIVELAEATLLSTEVNTAAYRSRNDPVEPVASTSTWQPRFASPRESQTSRHSGSRSRSCATAMRFWRRRRQPAVSNKTIAPPVFKRKIRSAGRKKLLSAAATTDDGETKITQIEPSTVQTVGEGNKRRTYVNVRMQTSGAIVTRILSELLVGGEKTKGLLMSITLQQSESNDDVSDRKEAETQTPSSDVTSVGTDAFDCSDQRPLPIMTTTRTVQCFVCDKRNCYEIRSTSDDSITLEEALIAEYPEETLERNDIAKRKTVVKNPL